MPQEPASQLSESQPRIPAARESLDFRSQLKGLLNQFSRENRSNTPDFLLAQFLVRVLDAGDMMINDREAWYGISRKAGDAALCPTMPRACFTKMAPQPGYKFEIVAGIVHHVPEDMEFPQPPLEDHLP